MSKRRASGEGSIFRRKDGRWAGSIELGESAEGRRVRKTVYARTQAEAARKLSDLRRQLGLGVDLAHRSTLRAYVDRWLETKMQQVKPRTMELYRSYADMACQHLGNTELHRITPLGVQVALEAIRSRSGASTANKVRRLLFGALKQAVRWRLLASNPVDAVDQFKETPRPVTLWTVSEAKLFLDVARTNRLYALFYLMLSTGLRQGEVLALRWSDVRVDHFVVSRTVTRVGGRVQFSTPKTSRGERIVALSDDVLAVLRVHKQRQDSERHEVGTFFNETDLVFCNQLGDVITPMALHHVWRRLQARAGVPRVRLHDLRHLHVSLLVRRGLDPRTIADRIGHADASFTLRRYSHMFAAQRGDGAVRLTELLEYVRTPAN